MRVKTRGSDTSYLQVRRGGGAGPFGCLDAWGGGRCGSGGLIEPDAPEKGRSSSSSAHLPNQHHPSHPHEPCSILDSAVDAMMSRLAFLHKPHFCKVLTAKLPRGSDVVPFVVVTYFPLRDYNILPKKELHSSIWETS